MSEARNHHYLPQCYLLGFVQHRTKPKLFVVDGRTRASFTTRPRNIAAERDFNRIDVEGVDPNSVEANYAKFESLLAPALLRISSAGVIDDPDDYNLIFNLISICATRNKRWRRRWAAFQNDVWKKVLGVMTSSETIWRGTVDRAIAAGALDPSAPSEYQTARRFYEEDEYDVVTSTTAHVSLEIGSIDTLLPLIGRRLWTQVRAPKGSAFITSDHPVCLYFQDLSDRHALFPPGYGVRKTEVLFPVSENLAIIGRFEDTLPARIEATAETVAILNGRIVEFADRQVYARDGEFRYTLDVRRPDRRGAELVNDQNFVRGLPGDDD